MEYISDQIRHDIICALKKNRKKLLPFTEKRPIKWQPTQVPRRGTWTGCFTDAGAWEFILDQLEAGAEVEVLIMNHPPGKRGYVIKAQEERVYIKVEFVNGWVLARSFHWLD